MSTLGRQARGWGGRGLLALLLVLIPLAPLPPAGAQAVPAAWHATGITLADPTPPLCFDAAHMHVLLVNEAAGTVAYNWVSGQRWVVNDRRFAVCGPQGLLFAATPTGAWRFSVGDPVGRPSAHLPTAWA